MVENDRATGDTDRIDNLGIGLAAIGIFGAPIAMIVHLVGLFSGWWGNEHITWYIPLVGMALVGLGNAIDTHRGKIKSYQGVDDAE